jgi:choline dehydrogenase-like flavoprotein
MWGGTSLRFSRYEFGAPTLDGCTLSWPLRYEDLEPSYAVVEELMGVCGDTDGLPQLPDSAYSRDPYPLTPAEEDFRRAYRRRGTRAVSVRFVAGEGRGDGWPSFTMQGTALAAAERTRRMTLRASSLVTEVMVDRDTGLATGVRYVDTMRGSAHDVRARVVFLCAGTIETARLMLNSRGPRHPDGLGNSNGWVGRGLADHPVVRAAGVLRGYPPIDGYASSTRQCGLMIPPSTDDETPDNETLDNETPDHETRVRPFGMWVSLQRVARGGRPWGSVVAQGEMLPYGHNRVRLGAARDRWGVPVPLIECAHGPHEDRLYAAMRRGIAQVAAAAGLTIVVVSNALTVPGVNVHELGTARMGSSPDTSVLDADNRCWSCANVFVTDGACFPAGGWQNPTLTIMALSVRAGRRAAALLRERRY